MESSLGLVVIRSAGAFYVEAPGVKGWRYRAVLRDGKVAIESCQGQDAMGGDIWRSDEFCEIARQMRPFVEALVIALSHHLMDARNARTDELLDSVEKAQGTAKE
jgi:hypothetical protein